MPPIKSDTVHVHSPLAAQSVSGTMPTRQLARPIQGSKAAKQPRSLVGPPLAATANVVSFVGAPFSVSAPPRQRQDSPSKICQKSWQNTSHHWPGLQLWGGQAEAARQGGGTDPSHPWLPAQPDRQTNKQQSQRK